MTDRRFGIELEIAVMAKQRTAKVLRITGLRAAIEGCNHTTRNHWKVVSDSSVRDDFEVACPFLQRKTYTTLGRRLKVVAA
ncbi:MAG: amidoligase family protein [Desulfovibrio sp.]|uniref:amidoligase family protein n=1 Tax=Desulfovibrio sp. 7SRBS1 TaxID=3378064 RepID=UPI003B3C9C01